jgi:Skp family chaperone for outer membrane proteins
MKKRLLLATLFMLTAATAAHATTSNECRKAVIFKANQCFATVDPMDDYNHRLNAIDACYDKQDQQIQDCADKHGQ